MLVDDLPVLYGIERHLGDLKAFAGWLVRDVVFELDGELILANVGSIGFGAVDFMVPHPPLVLAADGVNAFRFGGHVRAAG